MKVKSKFLGLGAKLAAALLLVCGTATLTGCYSENDDVAIPYIAEDPIYTITGVVMDTQGKPMSGVKVGVSNSGAATRAVTDITTTGADGLYSISSKNDEYGKQIKKGDTPIAGENIVTFTTADGKSVFYKVTLQAAGVGGSSIGTQNVVIGEDINLPLVPEFVLVTEGPKAKTETFTSEKYKDLEIANTNDVTGKYSLNLWYKAGSVYEVTIEDAFASAPSDVKASLINYAREKIGNVTELTEQNNVYEFTLPSMCYLTQITTTAFVTDNVATVKYDGKEYVVKYKNYGNYTFNYSYGSWSHGHNPGHGHGHGEDFNAGGGIVESI